MSLPEERSDEFSILHSLLGDLSGQIVVVIGIRQTVPYEVKSSHSILPAYYTQEKTAKENPVLTSGSSSLEGGIL
jgi:hypothetical protein